MKERFEVDIDGTKVDVFHSGSASKMDEQENGRQELETALREALKNGETSGFWPYNNFEASVEWRVKEKDDTIMEKFKKGDRVRVIGNDNDLHTFPIGTQGVVHYVTVFDVCVIDGHQKTDWVYPHNLKLEDEYESAAR